MSNKDNKEARPILEPPSILEQEVERFIKHKFGFINTSDLNKEEIKLLEKEKELARECFVDGFNKAVKLVLISLGK